MIPSPSRDALRRPVAAAAAVLSFFLPCASRATVPPPPQLLPRDTVLMVTMPDYPKACAFFSNAPYGRLWHDPAMKAFRDKFDENFSGDVIKPLEQALGAHLSDFQNSARGQVTFALLPSQHGFDPVLLVDAKDHAAQLRTNLAAIVKKWSDAGKPVKTSQIREVTFTTLMVSPSDFSWDKIFPKPKTDSDAKPKPAELTFGQSDSLFIVGNSSEAIEKVLSRQAGGLVPALDDLATFHSDYEARFHNSPIYAWANTQGLMAALSKPDSADDSGGSHLDMLFNATGLSSISSVSFSYANSADGVGMELFVRAPEERRQGLLKLLAAGAKDSSPPPFVSADSAKFWRWRIDIPKSWHLLEDMLAASNPQIMGLLNVVLQNAGKDKDPNYNLKSELLNNLGDDVICCEKAPSQSTMTELKSPPSLYLIGSPSPERLASALKVAFGFVAQGAGGIQDRDFLGHKIYSAPLSSGAQGGPVTTLSFAAGGGYVGISTDASYLEQYLRSADNPPKPLADIAGFREAAQKVGGMNSGWFGYENQAADTRALFDVLRTQPDAFSDLVSTPGLSADTSTAAQLISKVHGWADFSLLPSYDDVSKYFYWSIYSGAFSPEGFSLKLYAPTPPRLR